MRPPREPNCRAAPFSETVDLDGEELGLVPRVDLGGAAGEEGNDALDAFAECGESLLLDLREGAFGDDVRDLEVVDAVDEDDETAVVDVAQSVFGVGLMAGEAEPENVDGNAFFDDGEMSGVAGGGVAAVAANG